MVIRHYTLRDAQENWESLKAAGVEVAGPTRGAPRSGRKFWWIVESPENESDILTKVLAVLSSTTERLSMSEWRFDHFQRQVAEKQSKVDAALAGIESAMKPLLSESRQRSLTPASQAA